MQCVLGVLGRWKPKGLQKATDRGRMDGLMNGWERDSRRPSLISTTYDAKKANLPLTLYGETQHDEDVGDGGRDIANVGQRSVRERGRRCWVWSWDCNFIYGLHESRTGPKWT